VINFYMNFIVTAGGSQPYSKEYVLYYIISCIVRDILSWTS